MGYVVINKTGTGAAQTGTNDSTTSDEKGVTIVNESYAPVTLDLHIGGAYKTTHSIKERDFLTLEHTGSHGAITLHNVKTTHGTSAQLNERVYAFHRH
tara:strand:+ start:160 stop:453 length:294 start_codon:yes stop_codon:yes gene_type:complete